MSEFARFILAVMAYVFGDYICKWLNRRKSDD